MFVHANQGQIKYVVTIQHKLITYNEIHMIIVEFLFQQDTQR